MTHDALLSLLHDVARGQRTPDEAAEAVRGFVDLGFANVDLDRAERRGLPEVVFGLGKTSTQVADICRALHERGQRALATRLEPEVAEEVRVRLDDLPIEYDATARCLAVQPAVPAPDETRYRGSILVVAAGTADRPVAAEATFAARLCGSPVEELHDVGVAGLHRLLAHLDQLRSASVLIVVAGLEGALPSVVAGLVGRPVIAVPTSVGYGASFGGVAALLGMINSCAAGVTVVNIDNGFGAAYAATLMNRLD